MKWIIGLFVLWLIGVLSGGGSSSSSRTNLKNKEHQQNSLKPILNEKEILKKEPAAEYLSKSWAEAQRIELNAKIEEDRVKYALPEQTNNYTPPIYPVKDTDTGETSNSKKDFSKSSEEIVSDLLKSLDLEINTEFEPEETNLSQNQIAIKNFIESRNITQLVHFTRYENLEGIMKHGLLTRSDLNILRIPSLMNDSLRLDGNENSISLSISFPNYKMFYKYRMNTLAKGWVVITINPSVLWEYDCAFCKYNAADSRIYNLPKSDLKGVNSLEEMFCENESNFGIRKQDRLKYFDPTDPQAEVLVCENIPKHKIIFFGFENSTLLVEFKSKGSCINAVMANQYFNSRSYVR